MDDFTFERPDQLVRRLKIGREEVMQRLLTSLIIRAPYPKWNSRSSPSAEGVAFLASMYEACFSTPWPGDSFVFVDEYELRGRSNTEKGGAPDWAVLWPDRAWLIELKSERASHRADQIPLYFTLGRHHHPEAAIDITYLTPWMQASHAVAHPWEQYAHLSWDEVVPLVRAAWKSPVSAAEQSVVDGVVEAIEQLELKPAEWRSRLMGDISVAFAAVPDVVEEAVETIVSAPAAPAQSDAAAEVDVIELAFNTACATADDGKQRALDVPFASLDAMLETRIAIRERIAEEPAGAGVRHVMAWLWRHESTGQPLTDAGRATGYEIRFSKYSKPQV